MLEPTHRWTFPGPADISAALERAAARWEVSPRMLTLLAGRGCTDPDALDAFMGPPEAGLHDPSLLPDAAVVLDRLQAAQARGERVLVVGDFDADGLSGLALLVLALRGCGIAADPYVPSREGEGHGLSLRAVEAARTAGCGVIATVDCGTSSPAEVEHAQTAGIDVIVTDHHYVAAGPPPALAFVNPQRADSRYPFRDLTGAGIAFKVAQLLLAGGRGNGLAAESLADLASIGTIADVAPLTGENRSLVRLGMDIMRRRPRPGIAALLERAGLAPDRLDPDAVAYVLAPRLNSAGRVGDAATAARLLLSDDPVAATALADEIERLNQFRRELGTQALAEARAAAGGGEDGQAIVVAGPWPVGVIGLVAGRLADASGRPTVVFSTTVSPWRGSARGRGDVNLADAFAVCASHLVRFGGHAQAAGCDMEGARFEAFRADFRRLFGDRVVNQRRELRIDLVVPIDDIDYALFRDLQRLEPTGVGNPVPTVAVLGAVATRVRGVSGGHTQLTLAKGREVVDAIAFGRPDLAEVVEAGDRLDLAVRLASRSFGGFESLQLEVLDAATGGFHSDAIAWPTGVGEGTGVAGPMSVGGPGSRPT